MYNGLFQVHCMDYSNFIVMTISSSLYQTRRKNPLAYKGLPVYSANIIESFPENLVVITFANTEGLL